MRKSGSVSNNTPRTTVTRHHLPLLWGQVPAVPAAIALSWGLAPLIRSVPYPAVHKPRQYARTVPGDRAGSPYLRERPRADHLGRTVVRPLRRRVPADRAGLRRPLSKAEGEFVSTNLYESPPPVQPDEPDNKGCIFPVKYADRENRGCISKDHLSSEMSRSPDTVPTVTAPSRHLKHSHNR